MERLKSFPHYIIRLGETKKTTTEDKAQTPRKKTNGWMRVPAPVKTDLTQTLVEEESLGILLFYHDHRKDSIEGSRN